MTLILGFILRSRNIRRGIHIYTAGVFTVINRLHQFGPTLGVLVAEPHIIGIRIDVARIRSGTAIKGEVGARKSPREVEEITCPQIRADVFRQVQNREGNLEEGFFENRMKHGGGKLAYVLLPVHILVGFVLMTRASEDLGLLAGQNLLAFRNLHPFAR